MNIITKLDKIEISIAEIITIIKNELINNYPSSIIEYVFNKNKEILLFFANTILENLKKIQNNDLKYNDFKGEVDLN